EEYTRSLGTFDVVYSWGVLHHTGAMWNALAAAADRVKSGGKLFVAIYNDQGRTSNTWRTVKSAYNRLPGPMRFSILGPAFVRLWGPTMVKDLARGQPMRSWRRYAQTSRRGMSPWRDVVDWVGGYPFEVAKPEEVFRFLREHGFSLSQMNTCGGGLGCNEFVFNAAGEGATSGS
ncbi:MAG: class I SAM-dependent methyltransferase, partial [Gemmatimonadetes bacterium]|nr:class I SAM-dependent methyltransferase [Gemmatimonadota bacterium]